MTALRFRDRMRGPVGLGSREPNDGARRGRLRRSRLAFDLAIAIDDVDAFLRDPEHVAGVTGHVHCEELGGRLEVTRGTFNLFRDGDAERTMRMRYRLFLHDEDGREATLSGFKDIVDDPGADAWRDATTLLVRVLSGHVDEAAERGGPAAARLTVAAGILRISAPGFLALLASMRASGGTPPARLRARWRFAALFLGRLRSVFRGVPASGHQADFPDPFVPGAEPFAGHPQGAWHRPPELDGLERRILALHTVDDRVLTLHQVRGPQPPTRGPVLLIHGSGVRANLFYGPPGRPSFVAALVDAGYDVWLENWRASIDLGISPYTLDEAARYDHPLAMAAVLEHSGASSLKVLCHCQGSTSFVMTALAGLAPNVTRVVSSAVSLHPVVPWASRLKLLLLRPVLGRLTPIVSAQWGVRPPTPLGWLVARWAAACAPRVPRPGVCPGQLHVRGGRRRPVAPCEPRRRDPRLDRARVRLRPDELPGPDGPQRAGGPPRAGRRPARPPSELRRRRAARRDAVDLRGGRPQPALHGREPAPHPRVVRQAPAGAPPAHRP